MTRPIDRRDVTAQRERDAGDHGARGLATGGCGWQRCRAGIEPDGARSVVLDALGRLPPCDPREVLAAPGLIRPVQAGGFECAPKSQRLPRATTEQISLRDGSVAP